MKKNYILLIFLVGCEFLLISPVHSSVFYSVVETAENLEVLSSEKIKGRVTNKDGEHIPQAIIATTVDQYSNSLVQSDSTGYFEIAVDDRSTALVVSAIGYLPRELALSEFNGQELLIISLEINPDFTLDEVKVSAKRQTVALTPDGLTYNMNDNPLKNGDTFEAIKFIPMVTVQNDVISVVGRGNPVVYVNNRKLNLSGEALVAYLKTLPAKNIEIVNVIRTPEAKYGGANSVLSIKLKEREDEGLKGSLSGQIWKTHDFKQTGSVTLDYAKSKWSSLLSVFVGNFRNYKEEEAETNYLKENYTVNRTGIDESKGHTYQMNFMGVYQFSDTKSLGLNVFGYMGDNDGEKETMTHYQHTDQYISSYSDNTDKGKRITANLNYQYHAKNGKNYLIADADYLYYTGKQDVINEMNNVDEQGEFLSLYSKEWQKVPQNTSIYSAKVEYGGKFGDGFKYDFGADAYYSTIRINNEYLGWKDNDFVFNPESSTDFDVDEFTPALFIDFSKTWNDKLYTSLGARFEYTRYKGEEHQQNSSFKTDFFRPLPQLNVFYQISQKHAIGYSAFYSLQRPSFNSLNPFIVRVSPTEYSVGNPYLQPTKNLFTELNYTFNNRHSFYLQYQLLTDMQNVTQRAVGDGVVENKPENVGKRNYVGFGYSTYFNYLNGRGYMNLSANYAWNSMKGDSEVGLLSYSRHLTSANFNNSFLLFPKQNIRFNIAGDYHSKEQTAYAITPLTLSFQLELSAQIKDFSATLYYRGSGYLNDGKLDTYRKTVTTNDFLVTNRYSGGEAFQVGIRVSYNFGNKKVKQLQERNTSNSRVKDRVGGKRN